MGKEDEGEEETPKLSRQAPEKVLEIIGRRSGKCKLKRQ